MAQERSTARSRRASASAIGSLLALAAACGSETDGPSAEPAKGGEAVGNPLATNESSPLQNPLAQPPAEQVENPLATQNPLAQPPAEQVQNPLATQDPLAQPPAEQTQNPLATEGSGASEPEAQTGATPVAQDVPPPPPTDAGRVAVSGALYEHPLGFRFRYPKSWKLQQVSEDVLALVPDDVRTNADGPTEIFLALGAPAEGATDPGHPEIVTAVDQLVRSTFPFLKRSGEVVGGRHGGRPSAAVTWKGETPTGDAYTATMWITILKDAGLGLTAICPDESFEERRPMVEAIFSTIHWEAPPVDEAVVGVWRNESTYISGEFSSVTVRKMGFQADGRAFWGSGGTSFGMSHSDSEGNFTGSSTGSARSDDVLEGRWNTANKRLYIVWASGEEEEFEYYIEGASMMLTPTDGGKIKVWERSQ